MKFDEKLKARAKKEGAPIPDGFDRKIDVLMDTLPEKAPVHKRRFQLVRAAVITVAALFVASVGAAAAAPAVLTMAQGVINYFQTKKDSEYADKLAEFEKYNAAVGVSETKNGLTLTIDNISTDDSYINIFYTLKSETPLEKPGEDTDPESWRAKWAAPVFWAEVDGKQLDTSGAILSEASFLDDRTLKGMHRLPLKETLADNFDLILYTGDTSESSDDSFRFSLSVDKSTVSVDSLTVEPNLDWHISTEEIKFGNGPEDTIGARNFDVKVERVSISPLSSTVTLSEVSSNPFSSFVIKDENGRYLPVTSSDCIVGSSDFLPQRVRNIFEFYGADTSTKSLTLIPIISTGHNHRVQGPLDALPLTDDSENGYVMEALEVGDKLTTARFSIKGAADDTNAQIELIDKDGEIIEFTGGAYIESSVNRKTAEITATLYYPLATSEDLAKIKGVMFWQPDQFKLLEDQALTIHIQ